MANPIETLSNKLVRADFDVKTLQAVEGPDGLATLEVGGGEAAIKAWKRLRALNAETWYWPVLLGAEVTARDFAEGIAGWDPQQSTGDLLKKIAGVKPDPRAWYADDYGEATEDGLGGDEPEDGWPDGPGAERYSIPFDILSSEPHAKVLVALVPSRAPWEMPIYLRFGSWNACPAPERHASLMKKWHADFGAEVVGITHDIVEMFVPRPPTTPEAARALAREQYFYCSDIVDQGVGSVAQLAATLMHAPTWYFWWD